MHISEMWPMSNIQVIGVRKGHPQTNELIMDKIHVSDSKELVFFNSSRIFFFISAGSNERGTLFQMRT